MCVHKCLTPTGKMPKIFALREQLWGVQQSLDGSEAGADLGLAGKKEETGSSAPSLSSARDFDFGGYFGKFEAEFYGAAASEEDVEEEDDLALITPEIEQASEEVQKVVSDEDDLASEVALPQNQLDEDEDEEDEDEKQEDDTGKRQFR